MCCIYPFCALSKEVTQKTYQSYGIIIYFYQIFIISQPFMIEKEKSQKGNIIF